MAEALVDDNNIGCFIDDNGVTCWVDELGNTLCCGDVLQGSGFSQARGRAKQHQIHFPGPWTLSR